ncbi:MAG: hypothetical protein K1000chlam4_00190 [Chlamydiae bacterium]|nr:hypothetical protein [Chlamydiota bacterium]
MSLEDIREEIDAIDDQLITLLEKRFDLVATLLPHKKQLTDEPREAEILSKIDSAYIQSLYREIFRHSKQMLKDLHFSEDLIES